MGQGLYNMLGWGVLTPPWLKDEDRMEELDAAVYDAGGRTAYEAAPYYLVIPLAVDSELLQSWWGLPPIPDDVPRYSSRTARRIEYDYPVPTEAKEKWRQVVELYREVGLPLSDPGLIIANDWD